MKLLFPRHATGRLFNELSGDVNALVESVLGDQSFGTNGRVQPSAERLTPAMDIVEHEDAYHLYLDLPGVRSQDVAIDLEEEQLLITGKRVCPYESTSEEQFRRLERGWGEFRRAVRLPRTVERQEITASYDAGVLRVTLPKRKTAVARRIEITCPTRPGEIEGTASAASSETLPEG